MALHDTDTFRSLHALGEHLLAAARYEAAGHIGLTVVPGGVATPPFGDDDRVLAVVDRTIRLSTRDGDQEAPVTTLRAAADFTQTVLGAPSHVYPPATPCRPDAPLALDPDEWAQITSWYQVVAAALDELRADLRDDDPSDVVLWPEHFDVAVRAAGTNFGGLAGDAVVARPYAYVGPPEDVPRVPGSFWNAPFGAASAASVRSTGAVLSFFRAGRRAVTAESAESTRISPG